MSRLLAWLFPVRLPRFTADELKNWRDIHLPIAEATERIFNMNQKLKAYWPGDRTT